MKVATPSYTPPRGGMTTLLSVVDCQANTISEHVILVVRFGAASLRSDEGA